MLTFPGGTGPLRWSDDGRRLFDTTADGPAVWDATDAAGPGG